MLTLGYCGYCGLTHFYPNDPGYDGVFLFGIVAILLMIAGAFGFAAALVWWFVDGIISAIRSRHPKS
jgi:hypothetical protein